MHAMHGYPYSMLYRMDSSNRQVSCGITATFFRRDCRVAVWMSTPSSNTSPLLGSIMRVINFNVVDLPMYTDRQAGRYTDWLSGTKYNVMYVWRSRDTDRFQRGRRWLHSDPCLF